MRLANVDFAGEVANEGGGQDSLLNAPGEHGFHQYHTGEKVCYQLRTIETLCPPTRSSLKWHGSEVELDFHQVVSTNKNYLDPWQSSVLQSYSYLCSK